jgi:hypothetical protein
MLRLADHRPVMKTFPCATAIPTIILSSAQGMISSIFCFVTGSQTKKLAASAMGSVPPPPAMSPPPKISPLSGS